ncbi:MAG TPA: hypothetical protein H9857_05485, partial [Candidatus Desulfovibrio intestinigallinarum]|nr:hypothetical protein [Candidatus Desulfovibrio intestinigallinarum]
MLFLEHFQSEMLCISNHTACRFAEKRGFFTHFGPGGAVLPPRVLPFFKVETLYSRGTAASGKTTVFLLPFILPIKARWGKDGG